MKWFYSDLHMTSVRILTASLFTPNSMKSNRPCLIWISEMEAGWFRCPFIMIIKCGWIPLLISQIIHNPYLASGHGRLNIIFEILYYYCNHRLSIYQYTVAPHHQISDAVIISSSIQSCWNCTWSYIFFFLCKIVLPMRLRYIYLRLWFFLHKYFSK